jgi:threonyl-tRNA synthetase
MNKFPYMLIVGEQEERDGTVSVRKHGEGDQGSIPVEDFAKLIDAEVRSTIKEF